MHTLNAATASMPHARPIHTIAERLWPLVAAANAAALLALGLVVLLHAARQDDVAQLPAGRATLCFADQPKRSQALPSCKILTGCTET